MKSYVVWNNKGGVGKSTIVFNLASRYAEVNPEKKILVIDLCPQANTTMMLLGGGLDGEKNLIQLQAKSDTIVGYIDDRIKLLSGERISHKSYILEVYQYNHNLPKNLWVVPGDGNLELIAPAISYYSNAQMPSSAWKNVHYWIRNLISDITKDEDAWVVFIDTNPSFAIHTELAIVASTHLIVPFKADDSSRVATKALFDLLYGSNPPHPVYSKYTFAQKAAENGVPIPFCHLFIGNQFTQYLGSAKAFKGMSQAVMSELYKLYQNNPKRYSKTTEEITSQESFKRNFVYELRDFNSAGVVAAHQGRLLSGLQETEYVVHNEYVKLEKSRIRGCAESIDIIVSKL